MVRLGQFFFRDRNVVGPAILLVVLAFSTPQHVLGDPGADTWTDLVGALVALGCILIVNAPQFHFVALPAIAFVYAAIIAAEEHCLRDKFGAEFDDYCARVPRLLPRIAGFRDSVEGMRFNWRRVRVKDCNTILVSLLMVLFLTVWDDYRIIGRGALPATEVEILVLTAWAAIYLVVWRLKKSRRLVGDRREPG